MEIRPPQPSVARMAFISVTAQFVQVGSIGDDQHKGDRRLRLHPFDHHWPGDFFEQKTYAGVYAESGDVPDRHVHRQHR